MRQSARLLCANNSPQPKPAGRWRGGRAKKGKRGRRPRTDEGRKQADERRRGGGFRLDLFQNGRGEGRQNKGRRQGEKAAAFTPAPPHTRPFPSTLSINTRRFVWLWRRGVDSVTRGRYSSLPCPAACAYACKPKKQGPVQSEA